MGGRSYIGYGAVRRGDFYCELFRRKRFFKKHYQGYCRVDRLQVHTRISIFVEESRVSDPPWTEGGRVRTSIDQHSQKSTLTVFSGIAFTIPTDRKDQVAGRRGHSELNNLILVCAIRSVLRRRLGSIVGSTYHCFWEQTDNFSGPVQFVLYKGRSYDCLTLEHDESSSSVEGVVGVPNCLNQTDVGLVLGCRGSKHVSRRG